MTYRTNLARRIAFVVATTGLALLTGCKNSSNPITNLDQIVFPASGISYERTVQPLFNVGCTLSGCHDRATTENNNLDLTSYAGLKADLLVVIPGDTGKSKLVWNIEGRPGSAPMPPSKPLNENQITGLKQWILEGAKDTP
ncbi:MAG TPA: hypothetical protein VMG34_08280 [Bacteroidota bacterium]|nr:hypothetical protein [Bacteroidota bacterium]